MTPEEFTQRLPRFAGDTAPSKPPFAFRNLSVRVFPLRASLDALQQVCDGYLNIVPAEIGRFRAMAPYTWVALLDYGQVSETEKESIVGWFAQTEVYFGVPVEWYRCVNGRWVFHDWAVISPFIFVDDDISVPLGRTVFGFPKILARVKEAASDWIRDSFAPVTLARIETMLFPELYKGKPLDSRVLLEVERDAPMSNFRIPVEATNPIAPWMIASKLAEAMAGFGRDAMRMAQAMRIAEPNPWMNPAFGIEMLNRLTPALAPGGHGFTLNSLNLKQFRSSSDARRISYQALTNGPMQVTAFNGAGPLGEERTAFGDLSGGYTIKLYDYESMPIARTLGLEGDRQPRGKGVDVITLKPVMPFWASLNVRYLKGVNLAWRTDEGGWRGSCGECLDDPGTGYRPSDGDAGRSANRGREHVRRKKSHVMPVRARGEQDDVKGTGEQSDWPLFNTTVTSPADEALAGPFEFKGTMIRVLPLLAYHHKLQKFVDGSINGALCDPESRARYKFDVWHRPDSQYGYVYLTAASLGTVTSRTNNVGDWAKYALSFLIPVKRQRKRHDGWHYDGVGLVPACLFVDTTVAAASRTEVLGIPTLRAEFVRPPTVWLEEGRPDLKSNQTLLRTETEVFAALYERQKAAMNPLIEISSRDFAGIGEPTSSVNPAEWAQRLQSEVKSKQAAKGARYYEFRGARALAIELLANPAVVPVDRTDDRVPFSFYTLKQFRDAADPGKACYQSLVRAPVVLDEVFDVGEIEETLRVRIHEFPSLNLVESLGIVAKTVYEQGAGIVYGTQAIRPFYIRANVHELDGERLCWRAGSSEWIYDEPPPPDKNPCGDTPLPPDKKPCFNVDLQAARGLDIGHPSEITSFMRQSSDRRCMEGKNEPCLSKVMSTVRESSPELRTMLMPSEDEVRTNIQSVEIAFREDLVKRCPDLKESGNLSADQRSALANLLTKRFEVETFEGSKIWDKHGGEEPLRTYSEKFEKCRGEWQFKQGIGELEAKVALEVIDPQMVIEAILSREWAHIDANARWRRAEKDLRAKLSALGGKIPFPHISPKLANLSASQEQEESSTEPLSKATKERYVKIERAFYQGIIDTQKARPGWSSTGWKLYEERMKPILDRMGDFTPLRLEMDYDRDQLSSWSIVLLVRIPEIDTLLNDDEAANEMKAEVEDAATRLRAAMRKIADLDILGEPSNEDLHVRAIRTRLCELLTELDLNKGELSVEIKNRRGRLIDMHRNAAEFAGQYCDAQRDAVFNMLAKTYQKPDFCVRRDSVESAATREYYFPISQSWDEHWYGGK